MDLVSVQGVSAELGAWDKAMSRGREVRRVRSVGSTGNETEGADKAATGVLLQSWRRDRWMKSGRSGAEERICRQPTGVSLHTLFPATVFEYHLESGSGVHCDIRCLSSRQNYHMQI